MLGKIGKLCDSSSTKPKVKKLHDADFDEFLSRISKTLYYGENLDVEDQHLSYPVIELAAEIYSDLKTGKSIDRLYLNEATDMTQRVQLNPCYLVLALVYLERLKDCNSRYLNDVAPSQLFLISLVLASKFHDDSEYELRLSMFDKFGDWSSSDIFHVELEFLNALQWNVHVSEQQFYDKLVDIEKLLATKIADKRKWFTYTEMNILMDDTMLGQLTSLLVTVSAVCLTTYTAGVLTLLASSTIASHVSATAALAILSTTAQLSLLTSNFIPSTTAATESNFPHVESSSLITRPDGHPLELEKQFETILDTYNSILLHEYHNDLNSNDYCNGLNIPYPKNDNFPLKLLPVINDENIDNNYLLNDSMNQQTNDKLKYIRIVREILFGPRENLNSIISKENVLTGRRDVLIKDLFLIRDFFLLYFISYKNILLDIKFDFSESTISSPSQLMYTSPNLKAINFLSNEKTKNSYPNKNFPLISSTRNNFSLFTDNYFPTLKNTSQDYYFSKFNFGTGDEVCENEMKFNRWSSNNFGENNSPIDFLFKQY